MSSPGASICTVEGCKAFVRSANAELCEKHYGQMRRNGYLGPKRRPVLMEHSEGYLLLAAQGHKLNTPGMQARVYEHRDAFLSHYGDGPFSCHWCQAELTWANLCVSRLDGDKTNNDILNLVPACGRCRNINSLPKMVRVNRDRLSKPLEINGEVKTIADWAEGAGLPSWLVGRRLKAGWSPQQALSPRGVRIMVRNDKGVPRPHRRAGATNAEKAPSTKPAPPKRLHVALG